MSSSSTPVDAIGDAQRALIAYTKRVADTLWEVQQQRGYATAHAAELGAALAAAGDELERLVDAVPDYAAILGERRCVH